MQLRHGPLASFSFGSEFQSTMVQLRTVAAILASQAVASLATPMIPFLAPAPTIRLDDATFSGFTSDKTEQFLGIPFAYPP